MKRLMISCAAMALLMSSCAVNERGELEFTWLFWTLLAIIVLSLVVGLIKDKKEADRRGVSVEDILEEERRELERKRETRRLNQRLNRKFGRSSDVDDEPSESENGSGCRIKDEEVQFMTISEPQREALFAANPATKRTKSLTGILVNVVGARYRTPTAKGIYCTLDVGDPVSLKLDPDNEHDDTAVKVMAKYNCIGYVPAEYSNVIYAYKCMDKFDKCYVIEPSSGDGLYGLEIVIFLKPGSL